MKAVFKDLYGVAININILHNRTELNLVATKIKHWFFKIKINVCWQESCGCEMELKFENRYLKMDKNVSRLRFA